MHNLWIFILHIFLIAECTYGTDVGPYFDPADGQAWELQYGKYPFRTYKTSNLTSPVVRRMVDSPECYDGRYIFASLRGGDVNKPEPIILDDKGHLVWAADMHGQQPYNFRVQEYQGQPHLTLWIGNDAVGGHGEGYYYLLNSSYQEVAKISPLNGFKADLHEMTITPEGTAIISIYKITSTVQRKRKIWIWDCIIQEVDIATKELVFEWRAADHHTLDETYSKIGSGGRNSHSPWDWYHLNSVQKDEHGNYLISARYTHTLTYIDGTTGDIIWILGGKRNMFKDLSDGSATDFASQHYARMHELAIFPKLLQAEIKAYDDNWSKDITTQKVVSLFDNGADDRIRVREYSRGLLLQISYPSKLSAESRPPEGELNDSHTVRLVHAYDHPDSVSGDSQGSVQVIPSSKPGRDPTIGIGYGQKPVFTEFSADGRVICDTRFAPKITVDGGSAQSYRTLKSEWVGQPAEPPKVVLAEDEYAAFVSWNGATEVKLWKLQHSSEPRSAMLWKDVTTVPKQGFETKIRFGSSVERYLRVVALDKNGKILSRTESIDFGDTEDITAIQAEFNTSSVIPIVDAHNIITTPTLPIKFVMFSLCALAFSLTVYGCYRQWHNWQRERLGKYAQVDDKSDEELYL